MQQMQEIQERQSLNALVHVEDALKISWQVSLRNIYKEKKLGVTPPKPTKKGRCGLRVTPLKTQSPRGALPPEGGVTPST